MSKIILSIFIIGSLLAISAPVYAQTNNNSQIAQEEAQGKAIYDKLQSNQTSCSKLTDDDFELLGDYYMGQMMGTAHAAMDNLMTQRMGENNNRLMHIALGKRLSGCNTSASFPSQGVGFLPMMGMMGNWSTSDNTNYNQPNGFYSMMGSWGWGWPMMGGYYGGFGWIPMILWWVIIVILIVALISWAVRRSRMDKEAKDKTPLEVLKDRYAKGEINKDEFEEKKKDLS